MRIQKILFSSSEQYSDFWNLQSKVWKLGLGIEPVCLLFGKKSNTDMSEEFGEVREMNFIEDIPKILQITFSKFYYTKFEPDTIWMTGDLDQFPLSKDWWTTNIASYPDNCYMHLNVDGCGNSHISSIEPDAWVKYGMRDSIKGNKGIPLPAHYHVFRGDLFEKVYGKHSFEEHIREVMRVITPEHLEHKKNDPPGYTTPNDEPFYWTAEETYTSTILWQKVKNNKVDFHGKAFQLSQTIDKGHHFDGQNYKFSMDDLKAGKYVHLHSARGFGNTCNDQAWWDEDGTIEHAPMGFAAYAPQATELIKNSGILDEE